MLKNRDHIGINLEIDPKKFRGLNAAQIKEYFSNSVLPEIIENANILNPGQMMWMYANSGMSTELIDAGIIDPAPDKK